MYFIRHHIRPAWRQVVACNMYVHCAQVNVGVLLLIRRRGAAVVNGTRGRRTTIQRGRTNYPCGCGELGPKRTIVKDVRRTAVHTRSKSVTHARVPIHLLVGTLITVAALAAGVLFVVRPGGVSQASGSEHSIGNGSAPVLIEEWSDFE